jgi:hypothetical protein
LHPPKLNDTIPAAEKGARTRAGKPNHPGNMHQRIPAVAATDRQEPMMESRLSSMKMEGYQMACSSWRVEQDGRLLSPDPSRCSPALAGEEMRENTNPNLLPSTGTKSDPKITVPTKKNSGERKLISLSLPPSSSASSSFFLPWNKKKCSKTTH